MKALWVQWVDAKTWSCEWIDGEDIKDFKLPVYESMGVVVKEDKDSIFIAQTTGDEYRNILGIHKGCILKQRKIA